MTAHVSADPDIAAQTAHERAGIAHGEALDAIQSVMSEPLDHTAFSSRPIDRMGNSLESPAAAPSPPTVEQALEAAHRARVLAGTARSSVAEAEARRAAPAAPSLTATLQHEQDELCKRLGELRANYSLQERALMAQIESVAARVAMAKEMSK